MTYGTPQPAARSRLTRLLFPRGVRVVHFVFIPATVMAIAVVGSRMLDRFVEPSLAGGGFEAYHAIRTIAIAVIMSSLIAFLAIQYRSAYEVQLRARNEALEATRDFLSHIIEGSAEGIVARDAEGRVTSWNPAAEAIYGWSAEEMLGQTVERLLSPDTDTRRSFEATESRLARGETIRDAEGRRIRKDGKPITVRITYSSILDATGRPAGRIGIVRDVTQLKEMEARLLERERLAAVGELAAVVAHEVRNPLAGIRGASEILLEGYDATDPRREIGEEVLRQVDRLNRTVQDLLLFARPKVMDPVPTDVHALLDRLRRVLQEDAANGSVEVRCEYGCEDPVVRVDARQMEQVFLNLLLNACQAMAHRGTVTVATRSAGEAVEVTVRDSGRGIPPDKMERIFKPFYTTRSEGTGLGLAICKKIVEAHAGRIEAASLPGGGALFTVTLLRGDRGKA